MTIEVVKTVHFVIESTFGCDIPTHESGGYVTFYKTEDEAKAHIADLAKQNGLTRGENDGDKWADTRWDEDNAIAWCDRNGNCWKAEYFCEQV